MQMTTFDGYENISQADKDNFIKTWMLANQHNIKIEIEDTNQSDSVKVKALNKETGSVICEYNDTKDKLGIMELYAKPNLKEDFKVKLVAKPGDIVYVIDAEFSPDNNFCMFMREENIKTATVRKVHGSNDTEADTCLNLVRFENNTEIKMGIVQQACFKNYEDAKEACRRTPLLGFKSWDEYINAIRDIITYDYELKLDVKHGETMVIEQKSDVWSTSLEAEAKTVVHKVRASRLIFECTRERVKAEVQLTPWLNYESSGEWVDNEGETNEVIVTPRGMGYKLKLDGYEVYDLVSTYKTEGTIKFVGTPDIKVSAREVANLRRVIEKKQKQLFDEMARMTGLGDTDSFNYLKQLQLQCSAELRLLYYLEHNQGNLDKFMIC